MTILGRRQPEPGRGAGVSIGGDNNAPVQNVVGENITHVGQSASVERAAVDTATVRELLAAFRAEVDRHGTTVPNVHMLRGMADSIEASLALPEAQAAGALRAIMQTLPNLVIGTAVQQGGEALAQALAGWLG